MKQKSFRNFFQWSSNHFYFIKAFYVIKYPDMGPRTKYYYIKFLSYEVKNVLPGKIQEIDIIISDKQPMVSKRACNYYYLLHKS